jgi:CRISPR-associated protein Csd1
MVLTKMVLVSNETEIGKEDAMERLDQSNREPAYVCGRLMAVLDAVQRAAIPGAKATIISRYFGTASSAPATVFGTLLRGAQPHLDKLRREREGAYYGLQTRLEEVLALLQSFPKTLTLKQQALFSLGYYHQRAADRAAARARKESKDTEQENEQSE